MKRNQWRLSLGALALALTTSAPALACTREPLGASSSQGGFVQRLTHAATSRLHAGTAWADTGSAVGGALLGPITKLLGGDFQDGFERGASLGRAAGFAAGVIYDSGADGSEQSRGTCPKQGVDVVRS